MTFHPFAFVDGESEVWLDELDYSKRIIALKNGDVDLPAGTQTTSGGAVAAQDDRERFVQLQISTWTRAETRKGFLPKLFKQNGCI